MQCQQCQVEMTESDALSRGGKTLCEDCAMEAGSQVKICDPWAIYLGSRTEENRAGEKPCLTDAQQDIVDYLKKAAPDCGPGDVGRDLGLSDQQLEREMAALVHMRKIRIQGGNGRVVISLA